MGYPTILIPGLQGKSSDNSTSEADFELTENEISWIGSINLLCVPIGSLTSGLFMEPIGKRRMMQVKIQKNKREKKNTIKIFSFQLKESISEQLQCFMVSINLSFKIESTLYEMYLICFLYLQLLNVPMIIAFAIFYFATDIWHIYIALGLSGMSGGLLEAPVSLTI